MKTLKKIKLGTLLLAIPLLMASCNNQQKQSTAQKTDATSGYEFVGGYPTAATVQNAYDEADLNRAVQCYRFFYPSMSALGAWDGNIATGMKPNEVYASIDATPKIWAFTPNSDTRYAALALDMSQCGPVVIEVPPGPIMSVVNDLNQLYVMDIGLPGPDKGKGGKHLVIPPGYTGKIPEGYYIGKSTTNRLLLMLRAMVLEGGVEAVNAMYEKVKIYPLDKNIKWPEAKWIDWAGQEKVVINPAPWEDNLQYWEKLSWLIDNEAVNPEYRSMYGELAELGIEKGKPFNPDTRMKAILEKAAKTGNAIMRVQSFADRRPDRIAWNDRKWEWAVLRYGADGQFNTENYTDLYAREKWFYQAQIESPAMFNRKPGAGSIYWLGARDNTGAYLDGSKNYKLTVPLPVPAKLFWSVTVYDAQTRGEIPIHPDKASAIRSLHEAKDLKGTFVNLYFGPEVPADKNALWVQTEPNKGWFTYFRIYGPEGPAFDGSWKPGDFEEVK